MGESTWTGRMLMMGLLVFFTISSTLVVVLYGSSASPDTPLSIVYNLCFWIFFSVVSWVNWLSYFTIMLISIFTPNSLEDLHQVLILWVGWLISSHTFIIAIWSQTWSSMWSQSARNAVSVLDFLCKSLIC